MGGDRLVADDAMQAVAAQEEDVAGLDLALDALDLDRFLHADRARQDMAHRMALRLLRGQQTARDHFLDLGMVAAQLLEPAAAHQIGAAVADPEHGIMRALNHQHDDGRAHRLAALPALGEDLLVGGGHRLRGFLARILVAKVEVDPAELADDPARGPFAALMPAHAVRHRPEALVACDMAVLVVRPDAALMGAGIAFDPEAAAAVDDRCRGLRRLGGGRLRRLGNGRRFRAEAGQPSDHPGMTPLAARNIHLSTAYRPDKAANGRRAHRYGSRRSPYSPSHCLPARLGFTAFNLWGNP